MVDLENPKYRVTRVVAVAPPKHPEKAGATYSVLGFLRPDHSDTYSRVYKSQIHGPGGSFQPNEKSERDIAAEKLMAETRWTVDPEDLIAIPAPNNLPYFVNVDPRNDEVTHSYAFLYDMLQFPEFITFDPWVNQAAIMLKVIAEKDVRSIYKDEDGKPVLHYKYAFNTREIYRAGFRLRLSLREKN